MEDLGSIPRLERSPGEGNGNPLQYACLQNPHGQRSLAGCSLWGRKESHMTEQLSTAHSTEAKKHHPEKESLLQTSPSPTSPKPSELLFDGRKCIRFVFCVLDVYSMFVWCMVYFSSLLKFFPVSLLAFYREKFSMKVIVLFSICPAVSPVFVFPLSEV